MSNKYFVASTALRAKYSVRYRLIEGKTRKGLMLEGTNSRCPFFLDQRNGTFSTVKQPVILRRSRTHAETKHLERRGRKGDLPRPVNV